MNSKKMIGISKKRKVAFALLAVWAYNLFIGPLSALALTSGPTQPEVKGFQPVTVTDMVDLQTGDFKYNIPLLDVDGYPINLNYQSGTGIDDEASWVGLGWTLNTGSVNRQVRGIPDDMKGDAIVTDHYTKPKITVGGRIRAKMEIGGYYSPIKGEGTISLGVFSDNYTGIGAEVGANPGISVSQGNDGPLTAGLGLGILSSTASGVDVTPYANLGVKASTDFNMTGVAGLSANLGYNTRSGMKGLSLNCSYGPSFMSNLVQFGGTMITYNTEPVMPKIQVPYQSSYGSFSIDGGPAAGIVFTGGGGTGYRSVREVLKRSNSHPGYGTLYAEQGKNVHGAVMDFIREKDNPVIPELPNLAIPVNTSDVFSYTSQVGGGQFKLYRGGTGVYFDNEAADVNSNTSLGFDAGFGTYGHGGTTLYKQKTNNVTRKWTAENLYLKSGDFQDLDPANPLNQHVYFKKTGETTMDRSDIVTQLHGTEALAVQVNGTTAQNAFTSYPIASPIARHTPAPAQTSISYLTAGEASISGLEKKLNNYDLNTLGSFIPVSNPVPKKENILPRVDNIRKSHHISEITVKDESGKRMVYGVPVYQNLQAEYSFAVGSRAVTPLAGTAQNPIVDQVASPAKEEDMGKGVGTETDNYYHKDSQPAYATSFLLSGVLSPDYVDRTGDGITDDDMGTAIRFNYSKIDGFQWRTPYANATLNKGLLADADDDKASVVYGQKELWYIQSIVSKTKIAFFITQDRDDALGVNGIGGGTNTTVRQRCLKEIRLYSRSDMSKPIKVVKFDYDYSLCPGTPNSNGGGQSGPHGKLTLVKLHFEYANTTKGQYFPYRFTYNTSYGTASNVGYATASTDRWGTYRPALAIPGQKFLNEEFPYANQEVDGGGKTSVSSNAGDAASLWHLNHISLPTGGAIDVSYEADDYAYVQDKKAMTMVKILGLVSANRGAVSKDNLSAATGFSISVVAPQNITDPTAWFKKNYLNGSDYIYSKFFVKIANSNSKVVTGLEWDYVPTYSEVESVDIVNNVAYVYLKPRSETGVQPANPISYSAWQRMKDEYPRYAYPGFDRRIGNEGASQGLATAVQAIFTAFGNLSELRENFYHKALRVGYANSINPDKSFVRVVKTDGFKLGGGVRVKKIKINDDWNEMGGSAYAKYYGQSYDYTTTEDNVTISSGVASYEPSVGNDENPLKQPVFYIQKIKGALDNFFDLEEPFGESFYPAPSVVYSKVTVTDLSDATAGADPVADPNLQTGYIVNEFYTAKDFPVKVTVLPIQKFQKPPSGKFSLVSTSSVDKLTLSQGYAIELNDMHGKPKAVRVFNQARSEISSTVYNYNTTDPTAGPLRLRNLVNVINPDGTVSQNQVIGRDIEFFTDMREQESVNDGNSINVGFDLVPAFGIPIPVPHWPSSGNTDYKLFRSACAVKVSQYYGIVSSVVKTVNGSSILTQNVAYDGQTGEPILTRTQNEFNKDIFTLNIPAYWAYKGMGPASANQGMVFDLNTNPDGTAFSDYSFLQVGDELINVNDANAGPYWVTQHVFVTYSELAGRRETPVKFIVNKYGEVVPGLRNIRAKIIGSGFKNMLNAGLTTITSLNSPLISDGANGLKLAIGAGDLTTLKVINASSNTYSDNWATQLPDVHVVTSNDPFDFTIMQGNQYPTGTTQTVMIDQMGPYNSGPVNIYYGLRETNAMIGDNNGALYSQNDGNTMGIFMPYYVPEDGTYLFGYDAGTKMSVSLDENCEGNIPFKFNVYTRIPGRRWQIEPVTLTKGWHNMRIELTYSTPNNDNQPNGGAVEIYKNSAGELYNAGMNNGQGLNLIFSTRNLIRNPSALVYEKKDGQTYYKYRYDDARSTPYSPCVPPPVTINPFLYGFQTNWRPFESLVFQQNRVYNNVLNGGNGRLDIANSGYFNNFYSAWYYSGNLDRWIRNDNLHYEQNQLASPHWTTANTVTLYDLYGQETENMDALGRFSAALFDFKGELPAAVASNARNRDIYANSLEDAAFRPFDINAIFPSKVSEFIQPSSGQTIKALAVKQDAHTGNYSVTLPPDGLAMVTKVYQYDQPAAPFLKEDSKYQYVKNNDSGVFGIYPNGFEPAWGVPKAKYLFNVWVKDGQTANKDINIGLSVNGTAQTLVCKALVEGWKLLEGTIDLNAMTGLADGKALTILIKPVAGATVLLDDLRIHPVNAQMKSYAYDDSTFRLMAELDENAFATYYEYDSEGLLVRVKKETERGIMTIKETRSSQKQGTP